MCYLDGHILMGISPKCFTFKFWDWDANHVNLARDLHARCQLDPFFLFFFI